MTPANAIDALAQRKQTIRDAIVAAAERDLGVQEEPRYSNWGPRVKEFLATVGIRAPASWCAAAACTWLKEGGAIPGIVKPSGYVPALADNARRAGVLVSAQSVAQSIGVVRPGDLLVVWETFDNPALNDYHHTGVVTDAPDAAGDFGTIEGNSDTDGSPQGYEVVRQRRNLHSVAQDGHARYAFVQTI